METTGTVVSFFGALPWTVIDVAGGARIELPATMLPVGTKKGDAVTLTISATVNEQGREHCVPDEEHEDFDEDAWEREHAAEISEAEELTERWAWGELTE